MDDPNAISVILVAHGSRAPVANESHISLCAVVSERTGRDVRPAFLELAEPSIGLAIDTAIASGYATVLVSPHFLLPGNHTLRDIPALVDDARHRHPEASIELTDHLGADPALVDLVVERVDRLG